MINERWQPKHRISYADDAMDPPCYRALCRCGWVSEWLRDFKRVEREGRIHMVEVEGRRV